MNTVNEMIFNLPIPAILLDETLGLVSATRGAFAMFGVRCLAQPGPEATAELETSLLARKNLFAMVGVASMRLTAAGTSDRFHWEDKGHFFQISMTAVPAETGLAFLLHFDDQTDRVAMARSTDQARSYLESVMSCISIGLVVTDRDLLLTNMNRTQEGFLKETGSDITALHAVGMQLFELFPDESEIEHVIQDVLSQGAVIGGIVERMSANDESERVFSVSFSPLRDNTNTIVGLIRICEDITEKEKMAEDLHQAEIKASSLDGMKKVIVTLNHEINNALTAVLGNTELLLYLCSDLPEDKKQMLQSIREHAERISTVTQKIQAMDKITTVKYLEDGPDMIETDTPETNLPE